MARSTDRTSWRTDRLSMKPMPRTGSATAITASSLASPPTRSPAPNRPTICYHWRQRLDADEATIRGRVITMASTVSAIIGTTTSTHSVTTAGPTA